jgi:pilus assembly protein CpaE
MASAFSGHTGGSMPSPDASVASGGAAPQLAVAVVDADQSARGRLAMQLGPGATPFGSIPELAERLSGQPVVLVLGPSFAGGLELAEAEQLLNGRRELGAIMVTDQVTTDLLQRALRAGVKDVIQAPVDTVQLADAITRAAATLSLSGPARAAAAPSGPTYLAGDGEVGKVMTVFSTKGGAGKSVVATNLAVLLAKRSERPVVLIDADLQFGDVAVMLKLSPTHTIVDAVSALERLDVNLLGNLLIEHKPSSLLVLPAPMEPAFADQIGAAEMVRIVEVLRTFCSYVVIDTPAYFNDVVLGLIEVSDDVLLVAGMDIPNIKNVKIGLQTLRLLNTPMEKLRLILNRANSKVKLDVGEVERTLGVVADGLIPSDVVVPQAVNKGEAVVLTAPRSAVARAIAELADLFMPMPTGAPRKRR